VSVQTKAAGSTDFAGMGCCCGGGDAGACGGEGHEEEAGAGFDVAVVVGEVRALVEGRRTIMEGSRAKNNNIPRLCQG